MSGRRCVQLRLPAAACLGHCPTLPDLACKWHQLLLRRIRHPPPPPLPADVRWHRHVRRTVGSRDPSRGGTAPRLAPHQHPGAQHGRPYQVLQLPHDISAGCIASPAWMQNLQEQLLRRGAPDHPRPAAVPCSRYAIGRLYDPATRTVAGLAPCHFVAIATPHLGCDTRLNPAQVRGSRSGSIPCCRDLLLAASAAAP